MKEHHIVGIMSGTSLDGLDVAFCTFWEECTHWKYRVEDAVTVPYPAEMRERLAHSVNLSALELTRLDVELGRFIALSVNRFLAEKELQPEWVASHGHTVFHQPDQGITLQIGNGAVIAAMTRIPTICDFRSMDVALGGQGAPLVPIGDRLLFSDYPICLNLGGFSNISFEYKGKRIAFDISPCNLPLNRLAQQQGLDFDKDGLMAASGNVDANLLAQLNSLAFYRQIPPKSLGLEWLQENFLPLLYDAPLSLQDKMRTLTEHIALQLTNVIQPLQGDTVFVTGGGAKNSFLMECLKRKSSKTIFTPDNQTIDYKEAIVFAFLGLLKSLGRINTLSSVTGARYDSSGGVVYEVKEDSLYSLHTKQ